MSEAQSQSTSSRAATPAARRISMKKMIALSTLVLSACAGPSGALRSSAGSFSEPWRGVLAKGEARSPADFRFSASESSYQGFYWGRALTAIALRDVHLGPSVHVEITEMGDLDGP